MGSGCCSTTSPTGKTWGDRVAAATDDFWPYVIGRVKERHATMLFVTEAYYWYYIPRSCLADSVAGSALVWA